MDYYPYVPPPDYLSHMYKKKNYQAKSHSRSTPEIPSVWWPEVRPEDKKIPSRRPLKSLKSLDIKEDTKEEKIRPEQRNYSNKPKIMKKKIFILTTASYHPVLPDVLWSLTFSFLTPDEHFFCLPKICTTFRNLQLVSESWPPVIDFRDISYDEYYVERALRKLVSIKDRTLKLWVENISTLAILKRVQRPENLHLLFAPGGTLNLEELTTLPISNLSLEQRILTSSDLSSLSLLPLTSLSVAYGGIAPGALRSLKNLSLKHLNLSFTLITDADIAGLQSFPLQSLNLWSCKKLTDLGLKSLPPSLTELKLGYTQISDAGALHLLSLKNLRYLDLSFTHISEVSLEQLSDLPLKRLMIEGIELPSNDTILLYKEDVVRGYRVRKVRKPRAHTPPDDDWW